MATRNSYAHNTRTEAKNNLQLSSANNSRGRQLFKSFFDF